MLPTPAGNGKFCKQIFFAKLVQKTKLFPSPQPQTAAKKLAKLLESIL
jgi:hypothetical protein